MCRGKDCGARRCPGDTSDARRARRYAASAASRTESLVRSSLRTEPPAPPVVDERPEVEKLAEEAASLRTALRACEKVASSSTEIFSGVRAIYGKDRDKMFSEFSRLLTEKLHAEGVDDRFMGTGDDALFDTDTGSFRWSVAEAEVTKLGARTDVWLDGELLDESQAVTEAIEEEKRLGHEYALARAEVGKALDQWPRRFAKPSMTEEEMAEISRYTGERDAAMAPLEERRSAADKAHEEARERVLAAKDAYYVRKRELLGQIRPMGGDLKWTDGGVKTSKVVGEEIAKAAAMLPSDWIEASNAGERGERSTWAFQSYGLKEMRVRESSKRSHYSAHKFVTRREVKTLRHNSSFLGKTREEYAAQLSADPRKRIVPREQWTEEEAQNASYDGLVYEECDVAFPGRAYYADSDHYGSAPKRRSALDGRKIVDDDGNLTLTGRAAQGWERHEYVDHSGDARVCWRRTRTRAEETKEAGLAELTYPKGSEGSSTTLHELTHRCEDANRTIGRLESRFVVRRTTDENGDRHPDEPYHDTEKHRTERVRPDSFVDRYIGKDYGSSTFHEVMTVGNEIALFGRMGGFGKVNTDHSEYEHSPNVRDDDHHAFVLGTLLSA